MTWTLDFSDNFNRADGALGSNWTNGWASVAAATIVSNQAVANAGGYDYYNGATYGDVAVEWTHVAGNTAIIIRGPSPALAFNGGTAYNASTFVTGGTNYFNLRQNNQLWDTIPGGVFSAGDIARVEAVGQLFTFYRNGVVFAKTLTPPLGFAGANAPNPGRVGISSMAPSSTATFDDFKIYVPSNPKGFFF